MDPVWEKSLGGEGRALRPSRSSLRGGYGRRLAGDEIRAEGGLEYGAKSWCLVLSARKDQYVHWCWHLCTEGTWKARILAQSALGRFQG